MSKFSEQNDDYFYLSRPFARKVEAALRKLTKDPTWSSMLADNLHKDIEKAEREHQKVKVYFDTSSDWFYEFRHENTKEATEIDFALSNICFADCHIHDEVA